jgi:hypothetical protein
MTPWKGTASGGGGGYKRIFLVSALGEVWLGSRPTQCTAEGRYLLSMMLGGSRSSSGLCGDEQNLSLSGIEHRFLRGQTLRQRTRIIKTPAKMCFACMHYTLVGEVADTVVFCKCG